MKGIGNGTVSDEGEEWWRPLFRDRRKLEGHEEQVARLAHTGLLEGDLFPLANYLKAGFDLEPLIRKRLVEMIEGQSGAEFTLAARKVRPGPGNEVSRRRALAKQSEIATFVREDHRAHGQMEAAVVAACDEFDVSRATVFKALKAADEWARAFSIDFESLRLAIESIKPKKLED